MVYLISMIIYYNIDTLIQTAKSENWCFKYGCTTCGCGEFRNHLDICLKEDKEGFLNSIYNYDFDTINNYNVLTTGIAIVCLHLRYLKYYDLEKKILWKWVERNDLPVRLADYVFYHIAGYSHDISLKRKWVNRCVLLASESDNISLVESMFIVLREKAKDYQELLNLAHVLAKKSGTINNLLLKFSLKEDHRLK